MSKGLRGLEGDFVRFLHFGVRFCYFRICLIGARKTSHGGSEDGVADEGGELLEGLHAGEGVAVAVEAGAPDGNRQVAGDVGHDSATDAALAGHAYAECEIA